MKTIKIIIISLLVGLNLTSCDFLEKDPTYTTPENFFKNEADATSWLTGTYAILGQSSFYGNEFLYLVGGDDLGHYGGANRGPNKSGLICNNANTSDPAVAALWYTLYSGINRANIFLENIDAVPDMNDDTRKQYKAEARFLRAFYYFTLVECWGDVPFKTTSTEDAYNLSIPRTDKQTIYDFIIKEMYGSAEDLKSAQDLNYLPGRVSKSAAWGMLARVYMFRAGEPKRDKEVGLANNTTSAEITEYFKKASYYAQLVKNEGHSLTAKYWDFFIDICSDKYNTALNKDKNRYQTVYAKYDGSAAAPTAGLHFTKELLQQVKDKGVDIAEVTLHVGLGTFRPVKVDNVLDHHMHSEFYMVSQEAADKINNAKKNGGRIISVGTTSTRTLEAASDENGMLKECSGWTDIFIYPGYSFKVIDCLITNFHLPQSTLVMLVSALAGREHVLNAYKEAVEERYRFFSFGDAMFITNDMHMDDEAAE